MLDFHHACFASLSSPALGVGLLDFEVSRALRLRASSPGGPVSCLLECPTPQRSPQTIAIILPSFPECLFRGARVQPSIPGVIECSEKPADSPAGSLRSAAAERPSPRRDLWSVLSSMAPASGSCGVGMLEVHMLGAISRAFFMTFHQTLRDVLANPKGRWNSKSRFQSSSVSERGAA